MVVAYILARVEAGKDKDVLEQVKKMSGVKQTSLTYGTYDLHVEVAFATLEEIDKFIFEGIRKVPGVTETVTLIVPKVV